MPDVPTSWELSREEWEAVVLDDLNRPAMKDRQRVIEVLMIRDGGICGLCKTPVDSGFREPHDPASPQADHIIEKSYGGPHTWENLRLAHGYCNKYRNNFPASVAVPEEVFREAFEQAVHRWENPHVYLPRAIAWDEGLIAEYRPKLAAAERELRKLVMADGDKDAITESARAVAHWAKLVKSAQTHRATLERRIAKHIAKGVTREK
ncbi:HNH endonuclease [Arthrobacter sp. efr-133-R2A-120]|uniref:HNH endonuclease n=1 Tax=Arthrobacter sp. efr-133-R2A-120 TaxID=3040277 RepID=UPI00254D66F9|nr:HNH endonuclease [Arthrobacter sp. efr-133-R2A-120]